jgi:predicted nucleotidyltransferase component of viral defense system
MTVPDLRYFGRIANETGFRTGPLETLFRLVELLNRLGVQFANELSLRGGTALNLLYLDVPRLSVDIDLDYVGTADPAEAQRRRPELLSEIEEIARQAGYDVVRERPSYAMAHLRLAYVDASGLSGQLKLDVNFLDRVPVLPPERVVLRHPFGDDIPASDVQTLALPELAASKAIALVRRALARDLFDVAMLSTLAGLDDDLLRIALVVRGASYPPPSPAEYSADVVERIQPSRWRSEVVALARRPVPVTLDAAKAQAAELLHRAFALTDDHREFLRLLDRGELRPELLPGTDLRDRVGANPGLLWRLRMGPETLEER